MSDALESDLNSYKTFNLFFTRALAPGKRPISDAEFVSPVDGAISQLGMINESQIFQAKGHQFSTSALLGKDDSLSASFRSGSFANIYLSPKDYHRIHMPCDGRLIGMRYIPGELFSVNPATARSIPGLFARNERVVCIFDASFGKFAVVLVGATIVGSIATVWHGVVAPPRSGIEQEWSYAQSSIDFKKGDELGRFLLGSTVVMLFPARSIKFNEEWRAEDLVQMGGEMGRQVQSEICK